MPKTLSIGDQAPIFKTQDQEGHYHASADYTGKWLVLYFYPKDNTPGCTTEACSFRDHYSAIKKYACILGVSPDSITSHQKFTLKYQLPFPLLVDADKSIARAYGVLAVKKMFGREFIGIKRTTFIIDPQGKIAQIYSQVKPAHHSLQVLDQLTQFNEQT